MKKSRKRFKFISIIVLAVVIITGVIAIVNKKSNTYAAETTIGSLTYTASSNKLAIKGTGTITQDWKDNTNLKSYITTITQVEIANNITGIGDSAFEGCTSLTKVTFKATSKVTSIGENAFSGCTSLSDMIDNTTKNRLPASITTIGNRAFSGCTNLAALDLNTGLTEIGNDVFENCSPTLKITLRSTAPITYPISDSGKYKIELYGQRGGDTASGGWDGERKVEGTRGSTVVGYMKLKKNNTLTTEIYLGGERCAEECEPSVGSKRIRYGGTGGAGIGFKLNSSDNVTAAAAGGGGATIFVCSELNAELHGGDSGLSVFDPDRAKSWNSPEPGIYCGATWNPEVEGPNGHVGWYAWWLGRCRRGWLPLLWTCCYILRKRGESRQSI